MVDGKKGKIQMKEKLFSAFNNLADSAIAAAPRVLMGIVLMVVGLAVAKIIEVVLRFILTRIRFDSLMERAGIDKTLQRIGLRQQLNVADSAHCVFPNADRPGPYRRRRSGAHRHFRRHWRVLRLSAQHHCRAAVAHRRRGGLAVRLGNGRWKRARNSGLDFAPALGKLVSGLIMFVVGMMAIGQLQIDTNMVRIVTSFILGAGALAFGLAFGLGTRDVVRNITAGFYLRSTC